MNLKKHASRQYKAEVRMSLSDEQQQALEEFQYAAKKAIEHPCTGTLYALHMAATECELLGLDPTKITPTGYEDEDNDSPT